MVFNMKPQPYIHSARGKGNDSFRGMGTCFTVRNAGFYLTSRNLSIVQLELISRHMHSLRPNKGQLTLICKYFRDANENYYSY